MLRSEVSNLVRYGELQPREFLILHDRRLVFLVVSKVACTSVKLTIGTAYGLEVARPSDIHERLLWARRVPAFEYAVGSCPNSCSDYFKFAVVRNPLDRMVSCYRNHVVRGDLVGLDGRATMESYRHMPANISFERFVRRVARIPDVLADRHFRGQFSSTHSRGRVLVDFVGRFENLAADWRTIARRCDLPAELQRANISARGGATWREFYTKELADVVFRRFRRDFESFGYLGSYREFRATADADVQR